MLTHKHIAIGSLTTAMFLTGMLGTSGGPLGASVSSFICTRIPWVSGCSSMSASAPERCGTRPAVAQQCADGSTMMLVCNANAKVWSGKCPPAPVCGDGTCTAHENIMICSLVTTIQPANPATPKVKPIRSVCHAVCDADCKRPSQTDQPCTIALCGAKPIMPALNCSDGKEHASGICTRQNDGTCRWQRNTCDDPAIIPPAPPQADPCTDSDGGVNTAVKGTLKENGVVVLEDSCTNDGRVNEGRCGKPPTPGYTKSWYSSIIACDTGKICSNGACVVRDAPAASCNTGYSCVIGGKVATGGGMQLAYECGNRYQHYDRPVVDATRPSCGGTGQCLKCETDYKPWTPNTGVPPTVPVPVPPRPPTTQPFCGNRIIEPPEKCDDGNQINGDGCSASCSSENNALCDVIICADNTKRYCGESPGVNTPIWGTPIGVEYTYDSVGNRSYKLVDGKPGYGCPRAAYNDPEFGLQPAGISTPCGSVLTNDYSQGKTGVSVEKALCLSCSAQGLGVACGVDSGCHCVQHL